LLLAATGGRAEVKQKMQGGRAKAKQKMQDCGAKKCKAVEHKFF
jgi:hypothetical protein